MSKMLWGFLTKIGMQFLTMCFSGWFCKTQYALLQVATTSYGAAYPIFNWCPGAEHILSFSLTVS